MVRPPDSLEFDKISRGKKTRYRDIREPRSHHVHNVMVPKGIPFFTGTAVVLGSHVSCCTRRRYLSVLSHHQASPQNTLCYHSFSLLKKKLCATTRAVTIPNIKYQISSQFGQVGVWSYFRVLVLCQQFGFGVVSQFGGLVLGRRLRAWFRVTVWNRRRVISWAFVSS